LSQREAAEVLGISVKAVENFIFRAKKNIQEKVDQQKES
jgi:DNA-directed RNA polymerase specialized sigma24 family protein